MSSASEFLRLEVLVWVMPCVLICIGVGVIMGRNLATRMSNHQLNEDRGKLVKAMQVLLESTEQLSLDVGTHKTELQHVGNQVADLVADGDLESVQNLLLQQIDAVVQSHKRLEDDLVVTRYQLQEQAQELDRTRLEAKTDDLSGLANRKAFDECLQFALANWNRHGVTFALALADVDHFKRINDTHGHDAGDRVVSRIGEVLQDHCRAHDVVARFGGDEFAIIFTEVTQEQSQIAAQRIRMAMERTNFDVGMEGARIAVTFSMGLAWPTESDSVESIFKRADRALYDAKRGGRNCLNVQSSGNTVPAGRVEHLSSNVPASSNAPSLACAAASVAVSER